MIVTVFGATGRLGRELLPRLAAAGHDVRAVVRRHEQQSLVEAPGVVAVLGDVEGGEYGDLSGALSGADALVWAVGASSLDAAGHPERIRDGGLRLVAVAEAIALPRWIQISSMYANRPDTAPPVMQASMRNKGAIDEALQASSLPWTIVRPGGLGEGPATGRVSVAEELAPGMIERADVAEVVVELLATGRGIGAAFDLVGGTTTVADAVASL